MPTYDFEGRVALVTVGARSQGRSHAVAFAHYGADVAILDVPAETLGFQYDPATPADLAETVRLIETEGATAVGIEGDVRCEADVARAVERTLAEFGRIDVLVNNAGIWTVVDAIAMDETTWNAALKTDLKGTWLCAKHVGRRFRDRDGSGRIVNVGSTASLVGTPGSAHYAAAKHGVIGLTKTLGLELGDTGVTVNAVCPTGVATPLIDGIVEAVGEKALERVSDASGSMNVIDEQLLDPADVTEAVLWLASDAARYVTGIAMPVDAGMTAK